MPKTRFQSFIFSIMMVFIMVFSMTAYTLSLKLGMLNTNILILALKEMWLEYVIVFCLIFFIVSHNSKKLAFKTFHPNNYHPVITRSAIQCFTVCQIVPIITLFARIVHNGFRNDWLFQWLKLAVICFPMALCLQLFIAGPVVRFIFNKIFN